MKFRIGTRGSKLALKQVEAVTNLLEHRFPEFEFEAKIIKTTGDKLVDAPLARIGGKGLFVSEINEAVSKSKVEFAVHSMKDVPITLPEDLEIVCVPKREEVNDSLISKEGLEIDELPKRATIGSSSIRRKAEVLNYRQDLLVKSIRGNVDTRLRKLQAGEYDAIIAAKAGLKRLGLERRITQDLPLDTFMPSVGQGAIAVVARRDFKFKSYLKTVNDFESMARVIAERALLKSLGGGCQVPVGVLTDAEDKLTIRAVALSPDGKQRIEARAIGKVTEAEKIGKAVAGKLLDSGADEILKQIYEK